SSVLRASPPPPRDPACPSRASGRWSRATVAGGFPCCIGSPCADMPSPVPRWTRWVRSLVGRRIPAGLLSPATSAFPRTQMGRRPRRTFRGLIGCSLALRPACSRDRHGGPLRRQLRRLRYLHRRADCYPLERSSCRVGISPTEDLHLFTAHCVPVSVPPAGYEAGESAFRPTVALDRDALRCKVKWRGSCVES